MPDGAPDRDAFPDRDASPEGDAFLLPIGRFARLASLSPKMLRQYDAQGLLQPERVDPETGYRYYSYRQLRVAETIRLLRSFDVPLATVRDLLAQGNDDAWAEALTAQREKLVAQLADLHGRLERLDSNLRLQRGMPACEATLREEPDLLVLSVRRSIAHADLDPFINDACVRMDAARVAKGLRPAGREVVLYHGLELSGEGLDVEVCLPLEDTGEDGRPHEAGGAPPDGCRRLPGGRHAVALHTGPWLDIRTTYCALFVWMAERGLEPGTPQRERYLTDERDTQDSDTFVTEIAWPVEATGEGRP